MSNGNVVRFPQGQQEFYPALIPPGVYRLAYHRHRIVKRFERDVLEVYFSVLDYGEHFEKTVVRYYTVRASEKRRSFTAKPRSDFVSDYCAVFDRRPSFNLGPVDDFKNVIIEGEVTTVNRNHRQKKHPEPMRYSTVRALLRKG